MADPIEMLLEHLLPKLRGFDRLDQHWLLTTLLDELGFAVGVGDADDPIEAIRDVGEGFVAAVLLAIRRHPERASDAYQAAHGVLVALLDEVQASQRNSEAASDDAPGDNYFAAT